MVEEHVLDELARQLDYYVDAYSKVRSIDLEIAELSERMAVLHAERIDAESLRDAASEAVASIAEDISDDDEAQVKALVEERLSPLVGLMVM